MESKPNRKIELLREKISKWLTKIQSENIEETDILAIYIGVFESENDEYVLHLVFSKAFDSDDDDWACEEENDLIPYNQYMKTNVSTSTDHFEFLNEVVGAVNQLKASGLPILNSINNIGVGYDDGDLKLI